MAEVLKVQKCILSIFGRNYCMKNSPKKHGFPVLRKKGYCRNRYKALRGINTGRFSISSFCLLSVEIDTKPFGALTHSKVA